MFTESLQIAEVSNVSSIVPGALVQSLVTAVQPDGLVLQVLGYFDGTIDQFHLSSGDPETPDLTPMSSWRRPFGSLALRSAIKRTAVAT